MTPHFTRAEVERGSRGGPIPDALLPCMQALLEEVAEPLRRRWGRMRVTSGFRPDDADSQHGKAEALDLHPLDADRLEVWAWIVVEVEAGRLPIDQAILYEDTSHFHVSHTLRRRNRGDLRAALAERRADGSVQYRPWRDYSGPLRTIGRQSSP